MRREYIRQQALSSVHISVVASRAYSPYTPDNGGMRARAELQARQWRAQGRRVEIIAESDQRGEEFTHLDADDNLVYRICGSRSYLFKAAGPLAPTPVRPHLRYAARLAEKLLELGVLWNRRIDEVRVIEPERGEAIVERAFDLGKRGALPSASHQFDGFQAEGRIRSLDVIMPTYNRREDLCVSLPGIVAQIDSLLAAGLDARLTVVHQNEDLPSRLFEALPELQHHPAVHFIFSSPPSLTRARNAGLAATSGALVVFVDDDVIVDDGFLQGHLAAATRHPTAAGIAGRILSRGEQRLTSQHRAVGQVRPSGFVDTHFESHDESATLVPITPMGVNMSYRRAAMDAWFGAAWFDETIAGSAFREETSLALEVFRRGGHFVFAPRASLYHLESTGGGSLNRDRRSLARRIEYQALEYDFLRRLYRPLGLLGMLLPLTSYLRDLKDVPRLKTFFAKSYIHLGGFIRRG